MYLITHAFRLQLRCTCVMLHLHLRSSYTYTYICFSSTLTSIISMGAHLRMQHLHVCTTINTCHYFIPVMVLAVIVCYILSYIIKVCCSHFFLIACKLLHALSGRKVPKLVSQAWKGVTMFIMKYPVSPD